jgi:hypothetical protein
MPCTTPRSTRLPVEPAVRKKVHHLARHIARPQQRHMRHGQHDVIVRAAKLRFGHRYRAVIRLRKRTE